MTEVVVTRAPKKRSDPPWLGGAAACMAVCLTHPIDQTKIRTQTLPPNFRQNVLQTALTSVKQGGVTGLWTGLSASLLRQCTYGAARFGIYGWLKDRGNRVGGGGYQVPLWVNGAIAGVVAGVVGAPAEVVLVRMCSDSNKPPGQQLHYKNSIDGLIRIIREEGLSRTMRGWEATVGRSVVMNASQLSCYDMFKQTLISTEYFGDDIRTHVLSSALGGTVAVTLVAPIDVIKSRVQSSVGNVGPLTVLKDLLSKEGPKALFRGWVPAWLRMAPTTTLTFVFMEKLRVLYQAAAVSV